MDKAIIIVMLLSCWGCQIPHIDNNGDAQGGHIKLRSILNVAKAQYHEARTTGDIKHAWYGAAISPGFQIFVHDGIFTVEGKELFQYEIMFGYETIDDAQLATVAEVIVFEDGTIKSRDLKAYKWTGDTWIPLPAMQRMNIRISEYRNGNIETGTDLVLFENDVIWNLCPELLFDK